jgi:hypothetical protein
MKTRSTFKAITIVDERFGVPLDTTGTVFFVVVVVVIVVRFYT